MKILLIYSENIENFPDSQALKKEFNCKNVAEFKGSRYDVEQGAKWSKVDPELLYTFGSRFLEIHQDCVNKFWEFETTSKYYDGECRAYLISSDVDRKLIDWWSLKHNYALRFVDITASQMKKAIDLVDAASSVESCHQYSSAVQLRESLLEDNSEHLTKTEITYIKRLRLEEDKIKLRYLSISERLKKVAKSIFTKNTW